MDLAPISLVLRVAFLAFLFLFLLWIARSARKDLIRTRSSAGPGVDRTVGPVPGGSRDAWLVVETSSNLEPGTRFDLFGGATLGRSGEAEIAFSDRYASGIHARVYPRGERFFIEDMNSTNGTLLDGAPVIGETELADGALVAIGDTSFRFVSEGAER
ncbi:MAG: FHA domain-containing protein [Solirubrobacterales bacterium]